MSKDLIKIEQREGIETVNARELHQFLEVKSRFNDWIRNRIEKYEFTNGIDYLHVTKKIVTERDQYYLSIDMAKELSMVENNKRGRDARRYFIECERRIKTVSVPELSEAEIVQQALIIQQKKIEQLSIKAQVADELAKKKGLYLPSTVGKIVMGKPNVFCQWLVDNVIMYRKG
jgi:anti-repressor protein